MEKASSSSNDSDKNNAEILDKTKKMNVKASPATLLAKNAVLLPTSFTPIPTTSNERKTLPNTTKSPTASGSATGKPIIITFSCYNLLRKNITKIYCYCFINEYNPICIQKE